MNSCTVEIIFILNKDSSLGRSPEAFGKILEATGEISINDDLLSYNNIDFTYLISEHGNRKDSLFIKMALQNITEENLVTFSKLLRIFKKIATESNLGNIQLIWDDISKSYAIRAYPLIHEIENLMRKLITKFMLHNVGLTWTKNALPDEIKNELKNLTKHKEIEFSNEHNVMYQVDFIQLSNFLFNAYRELEINELIRKITPLSFQDINESTFAEIKKIIPKTNWEKYFESNVNIPSEIIKKDWKTLYDLRCKIAHNRDFTKNNLDDVVKLTSKLIPILYEAINKTENLTIDKNDKSELANQFEENFLDNKKSDIELYVDSVVDLYYEIRKLYTLAFNEGPGDKKVSEVVALVFDNFMQNEKHQPSDVRRLINIAFDKENIDKYDNFELDELRKECEHIIQIIKSRISGIEITKEDTDSEE